MSFIKESYLAYKKVQEVLEKETSDHEIAMARSELEGIADKATATSSMLEGMTESGNPLPAWVQSKITNASDYITSVHDYLKYNPQINESVSLEETTFEKIYQMQQDGKSVEDIAKELNLKADLVKKVLGESKTISEGLSDAQIAQLKKEYEPLKGKTITTSQYQQLKNILFKLQDGDLEKLQKQNIPFASTGAGSILRVRKSPVKITNVTVPGLEGMAEESGWWHDGKTGYVRASDEDKKLIDWLKKNGYKPEKKEELIKESKASDDAKKQGLEYYGFGRYGKNSIVTHKSINGNLQSLPKNQQTKVDNKETQNKKPAEAKDVIKTIKDLNIDDLRVDDDKKFIHIVKEFDPTIDSIKDAKAEYMDIVKTLNQKGINYKPNASQDIEKEQEYMQINFSVKKEEAELKPVPSLEDSAKKHNVDIEVLKKQLEKGIKVEKEHTKDEKTAEKIALAHLDERPDYYDQLAKVEKQPVDEACWTGYKQVGLKKKGKRMVPNCVKEDKRLYIESIAAVKNKAEKTGMPYSILKQVYDRGMAAWKGGHRPGATQVQWALARVNSFVTKSSGTWGGADSDLAKKVKGD